MYLDIIQDNSIVTEKIEFALKSETTHFLGKTDKLGEILMFKN